MKDCALIQGAWYKKGVDATDWSRTNPNLKILFDWFVLWCKSEGIEVVVTSIIRPRIEGISKSDTHSEGRAFDARSTDFDEEQRERMIAECNKRFASCGAISKDGIVRPVVWHDSGLGEHFHFQVRRLRK